MFSPPSDQTVYMQNSGPFRLKIGTVYENLSTLIMVKKCYGP